MNIAPATITLDDVDEPQEYAFKDLSDRAKENARDKYRENQSLDYDWWDYIYDDAVKIASMMGIEIDTKPVRLMNGSTRYDPAIYFSGFWSQGDGACFEGRWYPVKDPLVSIAAVMDHAPQDTDLHEIAFDLANLSERCNKLIPDAYVRVTHSGHYSHENCTSFDIDLPTPDHVDEYNELQMEEWDALCTRQGLDFETFEEGIKEFLRDFMRWIYRQLEAEHDYLTSDECIDEYLSEFTFDEDGNEL